MRENKKYFKSMPSMVIERFIDFFFFFITNVKNHLLFFFFNSLSKTTNSH